MILALIIPPAGLVGLGVLFWTFLSARLAPGLATFAAAAVLLALRSALQEGRI